MNQKRNDVVLRVDLWIVVAAIATLVAGAILTTVVIDKSTVQMDPNAMMADRLQMMDSMLERMESARSEMDEAMQASELNSVQAHARQAVGHLSGEHGAMVYFDQMEGMMDMPHQHMMEMPAGHHNQMMSAMMAARSHLQMVQQHIEMTINSTDVESAHQHAQMGMEELQSAIGNSDSDDPSSGAFLYMMNQMKKMMGRMHRM